MGSKKTKNLSELSKQETIPKGIDPELLEISGSLEQYEKDMSRFIKRFVKKVEEMKKTKRGRRRLQKAGFHVEV